MMKKLILFLVVMLSLCSCGPKISDIRITGCKLESISVSGLHGLDVILSVRVDNPVRDITINDVSGSLKLNGVPALALVADDIKLQGRCEQDYTLPVSCKVDKEFDIFSLLISFKDSKSTKLTADISAKVKLGKGIGTILSFKDVPIDMFK